MAGIHESLHANSLYIIGKLTWDIAIQGQPPGAYSSDNVAVVTDS